MATDLEFQNPVPTPPRGCVVVLIDESAGQSALLAESTKTRAESIATAVNSLWNQLGAGPIVDLGLIGYRVEASGTADAGPRWEGALQGRGLVDGREVAACPAAVEDRVRRVPEPSGLSREESIRFPIWYTPRLGTPASALCEAFACCGRLLAERPAAGGLLAPALLLNLHGDLTAPIPWEAAVAGLEGGGPLLLAHAHLATSPRVPPTLYPSSDVHLPEPLRELFYATSVLPDALAAALRVAKVAVNPGARGLVYNGRMADLIRFLAIAKAYVQWIDQAATALAAQEAAAGAQAVGEKTLVATEKTVCVTGSAPLRDAGPGGVSPALAPQVLLVLVLDRSAADPAADEPHNAWLRLQRRVNELVAALAKRGKGLVHVAAIAYGGEPARPGAPAALGPWERAPWISDAELGPAAVRVEELTEQVSNGIGGLVTLVRKRPVFLDLPAAAAASPAEAFRAAAELLRASSGSPPGGPALALVLHVTRAEFTPEEADAAVALLPAGPLPCTLHHLVLTESPHPSLAYPAEASGLRTPILRRLWEHSGGLVGANALAQKRAWLNPQSRGIVVNGQFDLLAEGIEGALGTS